MIETKELTDIINNNKTNKVEDNLIFGDINKYVIELIRVSELYKFELKVKPKFKQEKETPLKEKSEKSIAEQINKNEIEEKPKEITQCINMNNFENVKIDYGNDVIRIKDSKYKYKVEKPTLRYQELWEKVGFYQEKTTQVKVRVQLWPEHLPYDHFKRKRAFLFC